MKVDTLANVKNQFSGVLTRLGSEPLFITRKGKIVAVLQSLSDVEVEDYLLRNSRRFWDLIESRRAQALASKTRLFDPAAYREKPLLSLAGNAVREKAGRYRSKSKHSAK
jgi:PHD/YefM family antitoxin component YafN of YafNO toxin-antitoxin module